MPLGPPPVHPLPIRLHTAVLMILIEPWVFAQEPGGPVSLVWIPEKLIPIVGTLKNRENSETEICCFDSKLCPRTVSLVPSVYTC